MHWTIGWLVLIVVLALVAAIGYPVFNRYKFNRFKQTFQQIDEQFALMQKQRMPPKMAVEQLRRGTRGSGILIQFTGRTLDISHPFYDKYCDKKSLKKYPWRKPGKK